MPKKSGRTPIHKTSPTRPSEPLIREDKTVISMQRRTMLDHTPGQSHYQSLTAEPLMVDGEPGVLIDKPRWKRDASNITSRWRKSHSCRAG
jgi:hypothetical protein